GGQPPASAPGPPVPAREEDHHAESLRPGAHPRPGPGRLGAAERPATRFARVAGPPVYGAAGGTGVGGGKAAHPVVSPRPSGPRAAAGDRTHRTSV
ncbi:MAG: hypothetical protein AVDCRST_MAG88-2190, partial [uncultured Thermomicrobiales bacterium]